MIQKKRPSKIWMQLYDKTSEGSYLQQLGPQFWYLWQLEIKHYPDWLNCGVVASYRPEVAGSSRWWVWGGSMPGCSRPTRTEHGSGRGSRSCSLVVWRAAVCQSPPADTAAPAPACVSCPSSRSGRIRTPTGGQESLSAATHSDNE